MASDSGIDSQSSPELTEDPPMSRTHQYRHMIKPMLERKRRARINKCIDQLKDLMVVALQKDGESITKLEKADVLELTVRHLRKLKSHGALGLTSPPTQTERYRAGYSFCAGEISKYMTSGASGVDVTVSARLLHHLSYCIRNLESVQPSTSTVSHSKILPQPSPSPLLITPGNIYQQPANFSEYLSQGKIDALRYSLGQPSPPIPAPLKQEPPVSPNSSLHPQLVRADVALVPRNLPRTDKEDDKAWRPWNVGP